VNSIVNKDCSGNIRRFPHPSKFEQNSGCFHIFGRLGLKGGLVLTILDFECAQTTVFEANWRYFASWE
jgi:hypothetical protein